MRLLAFLLFAGAVQATASSFAQTVTLSVDNAPLESVFKKLQVQTDYAFVYFNEDLLQASRVNVHVNNVTVEDVLQLCFKDQPLMYSINNKVVVIKRKEPEPAMAGLPPGITVTGRVLDEKASPLAGASVKVKGTTQGTHTDGEGRFELKQVDEHAVLVFTFVGYEATEVALNNRNSLTVSLRLSSSDLNQLVVTAQGISREKKALGYAVTTIGGEQVGEKPESDIGRLISGKSPGVNVTASTGISGSGTKITIRGFSSISGSTQPLFVVDGVPFNTNTNNLQNFSDGNQTTSSRFLDIDPNNIEDIQVLRGLSATVLYGEQGRNGVILVTTRSGAGKVQKKPLELSLFQSVYANEIASLPQYQHSYGNGSNNDYGAYYGNWGPAFKDLDSVAHPYSGRASFPQFNGKKMAYRPYNGVRDFFRQGATSTTSLTMGAGTSDLSYNATFSYINEDGFTPGNNLRKINAGLGVNSNLTDKITLSTTFNYAQSQQTTPPVAPGYGSGVYGGGSSVFADLFYTPVNIDLMGLPFEDPVTHANAYYRSGGDIQNPRWTVKNVIQTDDSRRFFGKAALTYKFSNALSLLYRGGLDTYTETQEVSYNKGGVQVPNGSYSSTSITNTVWNHDLILTFNKRLHTDFSLNVIVGANEKIEKYNSIGQKSTNQLVYGFMNHGNFTTNESINDWQEQKNTMGVYGQATVDYRQYLYLNVAGRNDWYSSLEKDNRSIFYPSASVSFLPTTLFPDFKSNTLNFLKLRLGYGTSAKSPEPYSTRNVLYSTARAFVDNAGSVFTTNAVSDVLGNPNLKPELQQEWEAGAEARLFNNKLGVDLTFFNRTTRNLITTMPLDPSTGYLSTSANIGKMGNKGVELALTITPLATRDWRWTATINFYSYRSKVLRLATGLSQVQIAGFSGDLGNYAIEGKPYNIIMGLGHKTDSKGNLLVDGNGNYIDGDTIQALGNPNPTFTSSLINSVSFRNFTFSFQFDYRQGGDIYSITEQTYLARGVTKDTEFDRARTFILKGVSESTGLPNTIQVTPSAAYYKNYVWDGTTVRLREVSLSYSLPHGILSRTPFKSASLMAQGQNLWFKAIHFPKYSNYDTDQLGMGVGNGMGIDLLTGPSSRRFGASLKLNF